MWLPADVSRPSSTGALKLGQVSNAVATLSVQVIKTHRPARMYQTG